MGRSYEGECQLCGDWCVLTDDHIPQKSLYPKSVRSSIKKMNSIRACSNCNNGASIEDEQLKAIVGNVAHSFWDGEMWNGAVSRVSS